MPSDFFFGTCCHCFRLQDNGHCPLLFMHFELNIKTKTLSGVGPRRF